jgi:RNA polymerase sigma-70 factor, ECF subfamily
LSKRPDKIDSTTRWSLLVRVRNLADAGSWRDFVECYGPRVFEWCRQLGLQEADAADATQQVLLKLVDQLQGFDYDPGKGRFRSWLKTVTRHVATDVLRQWRERGSGGQASPEAVEPADAAPGPEQMLFAALEAGWREEVLRLAEARVRLRVQPASWRAWELACREQLSAAEIARQLDLAVADVYVAKSRITKMLRAEVRLIDPSDASDASDGPDVSGRSR